MEARILVVVARALHEAGMQGRDIGALSPYNAQIALFQHLAQEMNVPGLDCITVDRSQVPLRYQTCSLYVVGLYMLLCCLYSSWLEDDVVACSITMLSLIPELRWVFGAQMSALIEPRGVVNTRVATGHALLSLWYAVTGSKMLDLCWVMCDE